MLRLRRLGLGCHEGEGVVGASAWPGRVDRSWLETMWRVPVVDDSKFRTHLFVTTLTNKNVREILNAFRVGNGNFENSKLFEGLVILNKKEGKTRQPQSYLSSLLFHLLFSSLLFSSLSSLLFSSLLFSSLLFSSLLFSSLLFSSLLFSFSSLLFSSLLFSSLLFSSLLFSSLLFSLFSSSSLLFCLCLSVSVCCCVLFCVAVVCVVRTWCYARVSGHSHARMQKQIKWVSASALTPSAGLTSRNPLRLFPQKAGSRRPQVQKITQPQGEEKRLRGTPTSPPLSFGGSGAQSFPSPRRWMPWIRNVMRRCTWTRLPGKLDPFTRVTTFIQEMTRSNRLSFTTPITNPG